MPSIHHTYCKPKKAHTTFNNQNELLQRLTMETACFIIQIKTNVFEKNKNEKQFFKIEIEINRTVTEMTMNGGK